MEKIIENKSINNIDAYSRCKPLEVEGKFNGRTGKFLVDTGAEVTVLSPRMIDRKSTKEVRNSRVKLGTINGITKDVKELEGII